MTIVKILANEQRHTPPGVLYYPVPVKAGFPSPAADYMEERIDLNAEYIKHPLSTFLVDCEGDSMINAFIPPKAKLIVDRSLTARNGDVVLAVVNGELTVKYLRKTDFKCWLVAANVKYNDIEITEEMNMQIWGVVTTILISTKEAPLCML
ncbi:MAG TPA: translesion error-prone DNA polymerase V autoproteolytic subunit [Chitinophagaceae bacterium]|jgi:DNA polymerase V|nr:translesion error-prone DNA polymerase V autoproteolytic subunit [Chitinophagaceae bacterium]